MKSSYQTSRSDATGDGIGRRVYNRLMIHGVRAAWPAIKAILGLTIIVLVGRQFARDLRHLDLSQRTLHPAWAIVAGGLYLAGLAFSAFFWRRLLMRLGERPSARTILRAYYIGHLGKYLPGKAWALFLRAGLARADGVRFGLAVLTSFYEVLTTMASGALLAAILMAWLAPSSAGLLDWDAVRRLARLEAPEGGVLERSAALPLAGLLAVALLLPLWPPTFNRLVRRLPIGMDEIPHLRFTWLVEGLALAGIGWLLLGASLAAVLQAMLVGEIHWTAAALARLPAGLALAYVAGFVVLVAPGGLGVREFFLVLFLAPELEMMAELPPDAARSIAVAAVLVLRLVWTAAELLAAGALYVGHWRFRNPRSGPGSGQRGQNQN